MTKSLVLTMIISLLYSCNTEDVVPLVDHSDVLTSTTEHGNNKGLPHSALQAVIEEVIAPFSETGIQATMFAKGRGIWTGVAGVSYADVPIRDDMVWEAASITKTFTAAAIFQLQEEKKLSLEDAISKWIPNNAFIPSNVKVVHLMGNTSGISSYNTHPNFIPDLVANPGKIWTSQELLDNYLMAPYFEAGTDWAYSNTNHLLLGMIIEEVTGNDISVEFRKRFFDPLKLTLTNYAHEEPFQGELVHRWADPFGTGTYIDFTALGFPMLELGSAWRTAGGVTTNPKDLVKWVTALFDGRVLSPKSLAQMLKFSPISEGFHPIKSQYGLGIWRYKLENGTALGHRGSITHRSYAVYFPNRKVSIAISVNRDFIDVFEITDELMEAIEVNHQEI